MFSWFKKSSTADILNYAQTFGIIATFVITVYFAVHSEHLQSNRDSADFMLKFDERMHAGISGLIFRTLEREGKLDNIHLNKDQLNAALAEFFGNYELLDEAFNYGLINNDMSYDAFVYDLDKALHDPKARKYLAASLQEDDDLYAGVFDIASVWKIQYPSISKTSEILQQK